MTEVEREILFGRIGALTFLVEVLLANLIRSMDEANRKVFLTSLQNFKAEMPQMDNDHLAVLASDIAVHATADVARCVANALKLIDAQ